jgi:hypothetical protein
MNDLYIAGVSFLLGTVWCPVFAWVKNKCVFHASNKAVEMSLMRMDAELNGIKALLKDKKNPKTQLLNDQLEKDFDDDSPSS